MRPALAGRTFRRRRIMRAILREPDGVSVHLYSANRLSPAPQPDLFSAALFKPFYIDTMQLSSIAKQSATYLVGDAARRVMAIIMLPLYTRYSVTGRIRDARID